MHTTTFALTRTRNALAALCCALLIAACASSPPKPVVDFKQDYNFSAVKTIAWYSESGIVSGDNPIGMSDIQVDRANTAISKVLEEKGYRFVADASKADLLVSWHLVTQDKTDVRTYETPTGYYGGGYGYGPYNRYSMYNCWSCQPTRTEVSVQNYTEGTFVVDMIDRELRKSVWRSVTQSRLKDERREDAQSYHDAAALVLAGFPPS